MNRTRRIRIVAIISLIVVLVLSVGMYFVSDYFVDYAIGRKDPAFEDDLSPTYEKSEKEQANRDLAEIRVDEFHQNIGYEEIYMTSDDGLELYSKMFTQDSDLWAIVVHGYTSKNDDVQDVALEYYNRGYNVLTPDMRGHNMSGGDYITMGYYDGKDVANWANLIAQQNPDAEIVLHGFSMGGATVLIAAGEESLPNNVFAVIEDSGYTDAYQMFVEQLEFRFGLPDFPILDFSAMLAEARADYNLRDASPLEAIKNASMPIMFTHGDVDGYVLPYMLDELYDSYEGEKEKLLIAGADHTAARYLEPELYYNAVFEFIEKHN